jgi:hypothetical protein
MPPWRVALLPAASDLATMPVHHSCRWRGGDCYHGSMVLLPMATNPATMGVQPCYRRGAEIATMDVWCCCRRRLALLPWVCNLATGGGRHRYHSCMVLLPTKGSVAADGMELCYWWRLALLPRMCGVATDGGMPCFRRRAAFLPLGGR